MYETSTYELKEQMYSPVQVGRKVLVVNSLGSELSYMFDYVDIGPVGS